MIYQALQRLVLVADSNAIDEVSFLGERARGIIQDGFVEVLALLLISVVASPVHAVFVSENNIAKVPNVHHGHLASRIGKEQKPTARPPIADTVAIDEKAITVENDQIKRNTSEQLAPLLGSGILQLEENEERQARSTVLLEVIPLAIGWRVGDDHVGLGESHHLDTCITQHAGEGTSGWNECRKTSINDSLVIPSAIVTSSGTSSKTGSGDFLAGLAALAPLERAILEMTISSAISSMADESSPILKGGGMSGVLDGGGTY